MPVGMWKAIRYRAAEEGTAEVTASRRAELRAMTVSAASRVRASLRPPSDIIRGTNTAVVRLGADGRVMFMQICVLAASTLGPEE